MWPNARFRQELNSCALDRTPPTLKIVWAILITFEFFAFLMVLFNGLSRPRGGDAFLLKILLRDGIIFFLIISALGWVNLTVSITESPSRSELGIFCIWAMCVTIVTRMMLNLREAEVWRKENCYEEYMTV